MIIQFSMQFGATEGLTLPIGFGGFVMVDPSVRRSRVQLKRERQEGKHNCFESV